MNPESWKVFNRTICILGFLYMLTELSAQNVPIDEAMQYAECAHVVQPAGEPERAALLGIQKD